MLRLALVGSLVVGSLLTGGCFSEPTPAEPPPTDLRFGERIDLGLAANDDLTEVSGLEASAASAGLLWAHNDSGDGPRLFALDTTGAHRGIYRLAGAEARDWESLALGPGPEEGRSYLYVGETGDNLRQYGISYIYRLPEPAVGAAPVDTVLRTVDRIAFRYPGGPHDAEALLVDPATRDLWIVTKEDEAATVYRLPYPQSTTEITEAERLTRLDLRRLPGMRGFPNKITAGDIDPSGRYLLLKTYADVYLWARPDSGGTFFDQNVQHLPYTAEPQGEALTWAADGGGYYTLSEERDGIPTHLYFYPLLEE